MNDTKPSTAGDADYDSGMLREPLRSPTLHDDEIAIRRWEDDGGAALPDASVRWGMSLSAPMYLKSASHDSLTEVKRQGF